MKREANSGQLPSLWSADAHVRRRFVLGCWLDSVLSCSALDASQLPPPSSAPIDFARDIQPILESACLRCQLYQH